MFLFILACEKYGRGFTETKERYIDDHNALIMLAEFDECYKACLTATEFTCKAFEYAAQIQTCYLKLRTKLESDRGIWKNSVLVNHYQRDCA